MATFLITNKLCQQTSPTPLLLTGRTFFQASNKLLVFVEERTKGVKLVFRDDKLSIFSHSERGRAETQIAVKGSR